MYSSSAAKRYAKALYHLAESQDTIQIVLSDMQLVGSYFAASSELGTMVSSPVIKDEKKISILRALFDGKVSDTCLSLIHLLSEKGRLSLLSRIAPAFQSFHKERTGILDVSVRFAFEPEKKQLETLIQTLENKTGKTINLTSELDKSLLGGLQIQIQDTIIDGSVKNKLERMEERLFS